MYKPANKNDSLKIPDFVLSCLNGKIKEDEIRVLTESDWALIDEFARKELITTFLFYNFKKNDFLIFLPQNIRDVWQQHFYNNLKRNEIALLELSSILNKLKNCDIEVILLKGASLLVDVYSNSGLRHMGDVDILINERDVFKIIQILKEGGFNLINHSSGSFIGKFDIYLQFSSDNLFIEAFLNLYRYERFKGIIWNKQDDAWKDSRLVNLEGQLVRILSCQDQILHLCKHICIEDLLNNIIHFLDIKELIERHKNSLNWSKLLDGAKRQNLCNCLYYALFLAKKFFYADIPDWAIEQLKPFWLKRIFINLFINKGSIFNHNNMKKVKRNILHSLFMDRPLDSCKVLLRGIFPTRRWPPYQYGKVFKKDLSLLHEANL